MSRFDALFDEALGRAAAQNRRRALRRIEPLEGGRVRLDGRELIDVSSNDYLGLSRHPALIERSKAWAERYGAGSGASRLVRGTFDIHAEVEAKLAGLKGVEAALLFASGWQANAAVLPALFAAGDEPALVFADRLVHASLHHGCEAAGARQIRFRHNDMGHLERLLEERKGEPGRRFILTESVFSMDGDQVDIGRLVQIADRWGAFLYLDEAHATGVLGPRGCGLAATLPRGAPAIVMGTLGKALGGFGAYVAGPQLLIDALVQRCGGFIYSTAPPPAVLGALDAALDLVPAMEAERERLLASAERARQAAAARGFGVFGSTTQIVPIGLGAESRALGAQADLEKAGLLAVAIRPPTVAEGASRLRLSLSAAHDDEAVDRLIEAIGAIR